jgi:V/A-type H+/Na+-transporting ATPase subunit I
MPSPEHALPARMVRVAIVAPLARLREALAVVAAAGTVELAGSLPPPGGEALEALRRLEHNGSGPTPEPRLAAVQVDPAELERTGARDLLAGEVELSRRAEASVRHGSFAALVGWIPQAELETLQASLAAAGAAAVELPKPPWAEPPTLLTPVRAARPFRPLVETYGAARYTDIDPTLFAGVAFVVMFGMMFGDLGHGLLLALAALALRRVRRGRLLRFRPLWPLLLAGGLAAAVFGLLYGEAFGPTGLVPTLWLDPVDRPIPLLAAALALGGLLLAVSYGIGTVNRWRESGAAAAAVAPSGIAGSCVFLGAGLAALGWYVEMSALAIAGAALALAGVVLLATGFMLEAGRGATAVTQTGIEVVDALVRIGASVISFTRLAAFGLMHAALGAIVFAAAGAVWGGVAGAVLGVLVFVLGNAIAFGLELLVAGVQALRLEYYELFSRVFAGEGHRFEPWSIPTVPAKEEP